MNSSVDDPQFDESVTLNVTDSIASIDAGSWNTCAQTETHLLSDTDNPFVTHEFLRCLELSGAVGPKAGWLPQHLIIKDSTAGIAAAMPCYLKSHSQGEYVFDHGWADACERAGGRYYPKLQVAVPFTPVTGPRLLVRPGPDTPRLRNALVSGAVELCRLHEASSIHWTFLEAPDRDLMAETGMLLRTDQQFHWTNAGYGSFDDFLADLSSRKRKTIRKERRDATAEGIKIVRLTGCEIREADWDAFYTFYQDTGARKWGRPYLNRRFFSLVGEAMADRIVLVMARRNGRWIAGALNFAGAQTLYGRYWGCTEDHPFLHFEVCYYQAIEHAIEWRLSRVEAGAQGPHKLARGYLPVTSHSAHYIANPDLRRAIADYLHHERSYVAEESRFMAEHGPFRRHRT